MHTHTHIQIHTHTTTKTCFELSKDMEKGPKCLNRYSHMSNNVPKYGKRCKNSFTLFLIVSECSNAGPYIYNNLFQNMFFQEFTRYRKTRTCVCLWLRARMCCLPTCCLVCCSPLSSRKARILERVPRTDSLRHLPYLYKKHLFPCLHTRSRFHHTPVLHFKIFPGTG